MVRARILTAALLAAGFALAGFTSANAATIIQDGNFNNLLASGTFQTFNGGTSFGAGNAWSVLGNSIDEIGTYWTAPTPGGGSVDLSGNGQGGISQTLSIAAGTYQLSFFLSGNPDGGAGLRTVDVQVGGLSQLFGYNVTAANNLTDMNYTLETLTFTSTGPGDVLSFLSQDQGSYGPVIGGISIAAVPEAATWIMMILGFGGIGMMLRAQRRQSFIA